MMKSTPEKSSGRGPISQKILTTFAKARGKKVVDLNLFREARLNAQKLDESLLSEVELADLDPVHATYVSAQHRISMFAEQLSALPELSKLTDAVADAQDEYMPSYPPMSPITTSYFTCWAFFDLTTGLKRESFGGVIIDICRHLGVDEGFVSVFETMLNSRMGFYAVEGVSGKFVSLRELVTGAKMKAVSPGGYLGKKGQLWFTRVLPEPFPELGHGYSVVFTTPYVTVEMSGPKGRNYSIETKWMEFFDRNLPKTNIKDPVAAYEFFMKYGPDKQETKYRRPGMHYWNEYVFEGYLTHQDNMITLAGFPDIPLSRPHSKETRDLLDE